MEARIFRNATGVPAARKESATTGGN